MLAADPAAATRRTARVSGGRSGHNAAHACDRVRAWRRGQYTALYETLGARRLVRAAHRRQEADLLLVSEQRLCVSVMRSNRIHSH